MSSDHQAHARRVAGTSLLCLLGGAMACTAVIGGNDGKGVPASAGAAGILGTAGNAGAAPTSGGNSSVGGQAPGAPTGVTVTGSDGQTKFTCDPQKHPPIDALRALSTLQVESSLGDLVGWAMKDPAAGPKLLSELASTFAALPDNVPIVPLNDPVAAANFPDGGWLRADQDVQLTRVRGFYTVALALANALVSSARFGKVVGTCATDQETSNDSACLTNFIQGFGARTLRRPVTADELQFLQGVYGSSKTADSAAYADVITVLLNMPDALYLVEHGTDPVPNLAGTYSLGAYELASRLAYHVWDSAPDDELVAKAKDGSLLTDAVYKQEVDRVFADPRARTAMHRFFNDYIQVEHSGGPRGTGGLNYHDVALRITDPVFKAFAGSDLPTSALQGHLVDDAVSFLDYYTWTAPGTIHDLLSSKLSFAQTDDVAKLYGVPAWDGISAPPTLPDATRPGLFTRAVFLAAGGNTAPILKGVFLRRYVLCDTIGRPPPAAANAVFVQEPNQTTRQATEALTSGGACSVCHKPFLNPLGFATENFDGLGRFRTTERVFGADATIAATLPVDSVVTPHVFMADEQTKTSNASELMDTIDASNKPAACLARNYFRYTFARFEDTSVDACSLEPVRAALDNGGHLIDMLKAIVLTPAFKQRTFE